MMTLSDVLADADHDALADAVASALEAQQEEIDDGAPYRLDTIAGCPDITSIGLVLEMDRLHPEDRSAAEDWYREQWAQEVMAVLSLGDSIRVGA